MRFFPAIVLTIALASPVLARPGMICGPDGCRPARARVQLRTETVVEHKSTAVATRSHRDHPVLRAIFHPFKSFARAVRSRRCG